MSLTKASKASESLTSVAVYARRFKWVYTRGNKGTEHQRFRKGIDPGRPEEAYKICLSHREVSLSDMVLIYKLI